MNEIKVSSFSGMMLTNRSARRKSCHIANSSLKIPKWNGTWSNSDPRCERVATYLFSHDTTPFLFTIFVRRMFLWFLESTSTTKYLLNFLLLFFRWTVPDFALRRPEFYPNAVHVVFVMSQSGTETLFSPSTSALPSCCYHHHHQYHNWTSFIRLFVLYLEDVHGPVRGSSSN
jgi:hypothetical protein